MTKRILVGTMMCCLLMTAAGCAHQGSDGYNYTKNGEDAISYIEAKYNREFTPLSYDLADPLSSRDEVECYTDGMDTENGEHAIIYLMRENGQIQLHDNYFSFLVRDEAEQYIASFITKEYENCKVYRHTDRYAMPDNLIDGSTLEDLYKEDPQYNMSVTAYICDDGKGSDEKRVNRIVADLEATGHPFNIQIYVITKNIYDQIKRYHTDAFMDEYIVNSDSLDDILLCQYEDYIDGSWKKVW